VTDLPYTYFVRYTHCPDGNPMNNTPGMMCIGRNQPISTWTDVEAVANHVRDQLRDSVGLVILDNWKPLTGR
jgi:hypothetical protein